MTDQTPHDLPAAAQPEWIAVPQAPATPKPQRSTSKLGLISMGLGLVALLTSVISGFYLLPLAIAGAALGIVAAVLGVVALIRRVRPLAPTITGLVTGALAMCTAVFIGLFALGTLAVSGIIVTADEPNAPSEQPQWDQEDTDSTPSLLEWPANMASGGILFGAGLTPQRSEPLRQGDVPATSPINRANGPADIRLYVDYRCPHCASFEEANGDTLEDLVESGAATLELVPLTFLDRASEGTRYSSRAAAAVACVVNAQPNDAWDAHTALLDLDVQPQGSGPGLNNTELLAVIDDAIGGANAEVRDCVTTERFVSFASALSVWVFGNPVPNAVDPQQQVQGTPLVLVNGMPYTGDPADAAAFNAFLAESLGAPSN